MSSNSVSCTCGACAQAGGNLATPNNRPSLPALSYRRGRFSSIRAALLQDIGVARDQTAPIRALTARSDDHAITLAELWAAVGDVLSFYNERYANEAFLGTATQARSVERLARLVGYRRRPGTAAMTWLVFDADAGAVVALTAGTKVQSVPGPPPPDRPPPLPQAFETLEPAVVDHRLNRLHAYLGAQPGAAFNAGASGTILRRGAIGDPGSGLRPRDRVVLWGTAAGAVETAEVADVEERVDHVRVQWAAPLRGAAGVAPQVRVTTRVLRAFGAAAPATWMAPEAVPNTTPPATRWVFRSLGSTVVAAGSTTFDLDARTDDITVGTELLVVSPAAARLVRVAAVGTATPTVGPLTDTITRLTVTPALPTYDRAQVAAHVVGHPVAGWGDDYPATPLAATVHLPVWSAPPVDGRPAVEIGRQLASRRWQPGEILPLDAFTAGMVLIAEPDEPQAFLAQCPRPVVFHLVKATAPTFDATGFGHLRLDLRADDDAELAAARWPAAQSLWLRGNVVRASHGETVVETLGDGDAAQPFQRFALSKRPLTYVPSATAGGAATTLAVFVDGVHRPEVTALYGQAPDAPLIETATRPDGVTLVLGGDDRTAARFSTGSGNVTARYRVGSGVAGRVPAGSLITPLAKPVGLRAVTNPLAAEGGADPEPAAAMRSLAPASVRTLGRAVSLRDIEDLLLLSGSVAKAQAVWLWNGLTRFVHLSVAASDDGQLSATLRTLIAASLDAAREPSARIAVDDARRVDIELHASVVIDERAQDPAAVLAAVDACARTLLGFDHARLGQGIALSDVIAALAAVPLVVGVDVDRFGFVAAQFSAAELAVHGVAVTATGQPEPIQPRLRALPARPGPTPGSVAPAELLLVRRPAHIMISDGGRG
jgi:hypothetical protein